MITIMMMHPSHHPEDPYPDGVMIIMIMVMRIKTMVYPPTPTPLELFRKFIRCGDAIRP